MLPFIRSDLAQLTTYKADPEGSERPPTQGRVDRLDTNECPYDLPPDLKRSLSDLYQTQIEANRYPNGDHRALKQAIAAYASEALAGDLDAQWISVGNGSDELIRSVLMATCLGGEGSVLVAQPTFSMYAILAKTLGIPVVSVNRTPSFAIDLAAAQQALTAPHHPPIRVVFVVHPNSPTANPLTSSEVEWLESLPEEVLVVVDEAYFEFSQQTLIAQVLQRPNWMILRTFSKAFRLAAHRVGYGVAHPEIITTLEKLRLPYNLTALSLAAAELAMDHRHRLLEAIPGLLTERDNLLMQIKSLPHLKVWPSAANFIYAQAQTLAQSEQIHQAMQQQGTSIRFTGGGLRITVGSPPENQRTWERLRQLMPSC
ncbi:histidinol-phosphate transaminase [Lyngbya confervoides]|uniref:Histidinol-phosphate aminotransferase n=1 Tax=Lyngbya confervoides BDU141951 TaxID=1574623 RepID=A0ABD4T5F9_9CYAN|nr:histidinol-phosphate transaminase [Lyngbya confervoides]MCM1983795.1 histidinol-phosphate transaminase [Lyngbya confervoides BDU141951]